MAAGSRPHSARPQILGKEEVAGSIPALGSNDLMATAQLDISPELSPRTALQEHITRSIGRAGAEWLAQAFRSVRGVTPLARQQSSLATDGLDSTSAADRLVAQEYAHLCRPCSGWRQ
jgi:hypothetical protein